MRRQASFIAGFAAIAALVVLLPAGRRVIAADHLDAPTRTDAAVDPTPDIPADIADVYAWHTATKIIIAVSFAGPSIATKPATYDRDVLYTINISNGPVKTKPAFAIKYRFGVDRSGGTPRYGVQVTGAPGTSGAITGPVETRLEKDGVIARAGLFDDPFIFDLQGFRATRSSGILQFNNQRDFFAGTNLTVFIIEIPRDRIENADNPIGIWATSARFGGNL
jgi:hypothetical protein